MGSLPIVSSMLVVDRLEVDFSRSRWIDCLKSCVCWDDWIGLERCACRFWRGRCSIGRGGLDGGYVVNYLALWNGFSLASAILFAGRCDFACWQGVLAAIMSMIGHQIPLA